MALYKAAPGDRTFNAFDLGALLGPKVPPVVDVWPENWPAVDLFVRIGTQWRVGMGGASGLDYSVVWKMIERMRLSQDEEENLFEDIRYLEGEALKAMRTE